MNFSGDTRISTNTQFLPEKHGDISGLKKHYPTVNRGKLYYMLADEYTPDAGGKINYRAAYTAYLAIKNMLKNKGFYAEAGEFYYREMVCRRRAIRKNSLGAWRSWFWFWMRDAVIGYGEKPLRLIWWFAAAILLFAISF